MANLAKAATEEDLQLKESAQILLLEQIVRPKHNMCGGVGDCMPTNLIWTVKVAIVDPIWSLLALSDSPTKPTTGKGSMHDDILFLTVPFCCLVKRCVAAGGAGEDW